jgi:hypothetical protein
MMLANQEVKAEGTLKVRMFAMTLKSFGKPPYTGRPSVSQLNFGCKHSPATNLNSQPNMTKI